MAPLLLWGAGAQAAEPLRIVTFGGAYEQSQSSAIFRPFEKKTGSTLKIETYDGSLKAIKERIGLQGAAPDVVDVSAGALTRLCRDGLLAEIDGAALAGDHAAGGKDDFLPNAVSQCGVASLAWSATLVFNRKAGGRAPGKVADLLDIEHFPGRRALPKRAPYTLELALMADGVAPLDVYATLATPEGQDRAFAALDKIKASILWWQDPQVPLDLIRRNQAAMGLAYTGRIFQTAIEAPSRIGILWDGQIYDLDVWAIPKYAGDKDGAKDFIAFAVSPAQLAANAALTAYGPMRKSALALVGQHPEAGVDMKPFLPTAEDRLGSGLKFDQLWWDQHGEALEARFESWLKTPTAAVQPGNEATSTSP